MGRGAEEGWEILQYPGLRERCPGAGRADTAVVQ